jgi:glutamate dehydrogenase (NAD(P)+)
VVLAVCVSCWNHHEQKSFTYKKASGIKFDELISITDRFGEIDVTKARELGYEILPGEAWIEQEVDILVPAAIENQINAETAPKMAKSLKLLQKVLMVLLLRKQTKLLNHVIIWVIPGLLG